jgi:hypothetical protein
MMVPRPSTTDTAPRRAGCSGCQRRWSSLTQAHCQLCHEHFASHGLADKHHTYDERRKPTCHPPAQVRTKGGQRVFRLSEEAEGPVWRSFQRREDY